MGAPCRRSTRLDPTASHPPHAASRAEARYLARLREALRGRRILITGASSGIGQAFARQAGRAGAEAVLVARREEALEQVAETFLQLGGRRVHVVPADLSNVESSRRVAARLRDDGLPVDVLVQNAGRSLRRPILDCKPEDFERLMAVNYLGPTTLALGLLPDMLARGSGHVIQVGTIGVQTGAPNFAAYVAAKAAADHFARTLRLELGGRGLAVSSLQIPLVRTPMMAPTRVYRAFPALDVERAARRIGLAVVKRPVRVAPRWATALEVAHALAPGLVQWIFERAHDPFHVWMGRRLDRSGTRAERLSR